MYDTREISTQTIFGQLQVGPDLEISQDLLENMKNAKILYQIYQGNIINGWIGKTVQCWITYMDLVKMQCTFCTAVQENNFEITILLGIFSPI